MTEHVQVNGDIILYMGQHSSSGDPHNSICAWASILVQGTPTTFYVHGPAFQFRRPPQQYMCKGQHSSSGDPHDTICAWASIPVQGTLTAKHVQVNGVIILYMGQHSSLGDS
ncbi:hypothetical protein ACJMK2_023349 [Sinanodonta woodiana]|uniref:Uncharacterized protein n=1 Tax=Sinanodonta woodiana TaxID=1069815 RepID=A0ABD3T3W9_SINWO